MKGRFGAPDTFSVKIAAVVADGPFLVALQPSFAASQAGILVRDQRWSKGHGDRVEDLPATP